MYYNNNNNVTAYKLVSYQLLVIYVTFNSRV